jgi:WD40 repeat protein
VTLTEEDAMRKRQLLLGGGVLLAVTVCQGSRPACYGQQPRAILRAKGGPVHDVAFRPDGKTLAAACQDGTVELWEVLTAGRRAALRGHTDAVRCVACRGDGKLLASGSSDKTVRLWDVTTGKAKAVLRGHEFTVSCVAFSPDGRLLASAASDRVVLWDVDSGKEQASFRGLAAQAVAFAPDGKALACCGGSTVRLWEVPTGRHHDLLRRPGCHAVSVSFSPGGKLLAASSQTGGAWVWDVQAGKLRRLLREDWGGPLKERQFMSLLRFRRPLVFSPDGEKLALVGPSTIADAGVDITDVCLLDATARRPLAVLPGGARIPASLAFSPDARLLASAGLDGTIWLWDLQAIFKAQK